MANLNRLSKEFKRDPSKVKGLLLDTDETVLAKDDLWIHIPKRYITHEVSFIGDKIEILGICCIIDKHNNFGNLILNSIFEIEPSTIKEIKVDDVEYIEFYFPKNSTVIANKNVVKNEAIMFRLFQEFFMRANVPWYMNYEDLGGLFKTAKTLAGSNVGKSLATIELLTSVITRTTSDRKTYYRLDPKGKPSFVPLESVYYSYSNTTSKLLGSYKNTAITSALVSQAKTSEKVETLLRR